MEILQHTHSGLRWVVLILLLASIGNAAANMGGTKPYNRKLALFTLISAHLQLVLGLILYFGKKWYQALPEGADAMTKNVHRFFGMEHIGMMIIAIALITIGNSRAKKGATDKAKYKTILIFFGIALVCILAAIPWPFVQKFANYGWF